MRIVFRLDADETAERAAVLAKDPDVNVDGFEHALAAGLYAAFGASAEGLVVDAIDLEEASGQYLYTLAGAPR